MNTLSLSPEADYISAGFSDSHIKIWDVKGDKSHSSNIRSRNDANDWSRNYDSRTESSNTKHPHDRGDENDFSLHLIKETDDLINGGLLFTPRPGSSVRLIGHSGPVYSTSFSADQKYLVSCSSDMTGMLQDLETCLNSKIILGVYLTQMLKCVSSSLEPRAHEEFGRIQGPQLSYLGCRI